MVNKSIKEKLLKAYENKEERLLVSKLLDDINKFESKEVVITTDFLNIHEKEIAISILNYLNLDYVVSDILDSMERFIILLIPNYVEKSNILDKYIMCIRIKANSKGAFLGHRDYMGAIYSLGIDRKMIGDIITSNGQCYMFIQKSMEKYIINNLTHVGKNDVSLDIIGIYSDKLKDLHTTYKDVNIIVFSMRADLICSSLYNLSRNEIRRKIEAGDLIINSKEMYFCSETLNEGDIVSLRGFR